MKSLTVNLGERSYPIYIGDDLLGQADLPKRHIPGNSAIIVSNETVAPLYLEKTQAMLSGLKHEAIILPDGEQFKNLEVLNQIYDGLLRNHFDRNTTIIALGGGVVGDMAGFAAASYQRGVHLIQIPTTLLSQVDSSVGGKTGVNHALGKNMIGAFYQPKLVWIDPNVLQTLAPNQLRAGLAEVIKYGAIWDAEFFRYVEQHAKQLHELDTKTMSKVILDSCRYKAEIVMQDETEQGARALLNLGHTFGHAIESMTHYTGYLHGEAVAIGMCMAARLSEQLGHAPHGTESSMVSALQALELPVAPPMFTAEQWLDAMGHDKKNIGSLIRYILLRGIGEAFIAEDVKDSDIQTLIQSYA